MPDKSVIVVPFIFTPKLPALDDIVDIILATPVIDVKLADLIVFIILPA